MYVKGTESKDNIFPSDIRLFCRVTNLCLRSQSLHQGGDTDHTA